MHFLSENEKKQGKIEQKCFSDQPNVFTISSKSIFHFILKIQHVKVFENEIIGRYVDALKRSQEVD